MKQWVAVGGRPYNPELAVMRERGAGLVHEGSRLDYVPGSRVQCWALLRAAVRDRMTQIAGGQITEWWAWPPGNGGQMAVVPQDIILFGGSIADNIAYGRPGAAQAQIEAAARQANAHDFIMAFPEGYQTRVGERGVQLSGGQRQRVAIARAILRDPAILLLDEATSSLDSESESLVLDALDRLMRGRTAIVIAHRLSTVRGADRIFVLKDGSVVEAGSHAELMLHPEGVYRNLSLLQLSTRNPSAVLPAPEHAAALA